MSGLQSVALRDLQVRLVAVEKLIPYARNSRTHTEEPAGGAVPNRVDLNRNFLLSGTRFAVLPRRCDTLRCERAGPDSWITAYAGQAAKSATRGRSLRVSSRAARSARELGDKKRPLGWCFHFEVRVGVVRRAPAGKACLTRRLPRAFEPGYPLRLLILCHPFFESPFARIVQMPRLRPAPGSCILKLRFLVNFSAQTAS